MLPTDEIEITQAMMRAGAELVWEYEAGFDSAEDYARKIYEAMFRLRPNSEAEDTVA